MCRPAAGACDLDDKCDGASKTCPADALRPSTFTCRAKAGPCDVADKCTGTTRDCPADAFEPSSKSCRGKAGPCDVAETCTGASATCPADGMASAATICRDASGACDQPERCTGAAPACPADAVAPPGIVCRAAAGPCDAVETCNGAAKTCPANLRLPAGAVCRAANGTCDLAETCNGSSVACPADRTRPNGTACSDGSACTSGDVCTAGACIPSSIVVCAAADQCHAVGTCDPATGRCSNPAASDGASCNDGVACTKDDRCQAGVCAGISADSIRMLVADSRSGAILEYDLTSGTEAHTFIPPGLGGISAAVGLALHGGYLFVSNYDPSGSSVLRYDVATGGPAPSPGNTGAKFVSGSVADAMFFKFGPDGNLYMATNGGSRVDRYDGETGAPLPAPGFEGTATFALSYTNIGVDFGPDGNLYVANFAPASVWRMDPESGAFIDEFVQSDSALNGSRLADLLWAPDGNLYVGGRGAQNVTVGAVRRYAPDGQPLPAPGKPGALFTDTGQIVNSLAFGPDGFLYVSTWTYAGPTDLMKVDPTSGDIVAHLPLPAPDTGPAAIVFLPGESAPVCDDQNPCTADRCEVSSGCGHTPLADGISCSDGDACNGFEACRAGACGSPVPLPATVSVGTDAADVFVSRDGLRAYVTNSSGADSRLSIINTATRSVIETVPLPPRPSRITAAPDERTLFIGHGYEGLHNLVSVVELGPPSRVTSIDLGAGRYPGTDPVLHAPNGRLYAGRYPLGDLTTIDPGSGAILATTPLGRDYGNHVALSPDGARLYVSHFTPGGVTVFDIGQPVPIPLPAAGFDVPGGANGLAFLSSTDALVLGWGAGALYRYDLGTGAIRATIAIGPQSSPAALALAPDHQRAYVTSLLEDQLVVIELSDSSVVQRLPTGRGPFSVSLSPEGAVAYVTNATDGSLSMISVCRHLEVRLLPDPIFALPHQEVRFSTAVLDPLVGPVRFEYDLDGDGHLDFVQPAPGPLRYMYGAPGVYLATVRVFDSLGLIGSHVVSVTIVNPPF